MPCVEQHFPQAQLLPRQGSASCEGEEPGKVLRPVIVRVPAPPALHRFERRDRARGLGLLHEERQPPEITLLYLVGGGVEDQHLGEARPGEHLRVGFAPCGPAPVEDESRIGRDRRPVGHAGDCARGDRGPAIRRGPAHAQVAGKEPDAAAVQGHASRSVGGHGERSREGRRFAGRGEPQRCRALRNLQIELPALDLQRFSEPGRQPGGEHTPRRAGDDDAAIEGEAVNVEAEPADVWLDARAAQREGAFARISLEPEAPDRLARLQRGLAAERDVAGRWQLHHHERLVAVAKERQIDRLDVRHVPHGERHSIRFHGVRPRQPVYGAATGPCRGLEQTFAFGRRPGRFAQFDRSLAAVGLRDFEGEEREAPLAAGEGYNAQHERGTGDGSHGPDSTDARLRPQPGACYALGVARTFRLLALLVPGSIEAEIGALQQAVFAEHGLVSAIALPPLVPVRFLPVDAPPRLPQVPGREVAVRFAVRVTKPAWSGGHLFVGVETDGAWAALRGDERWTDGPALFPCFEGFFLRVRGSRTRGPRRHRRAPDGTSIHFPGHHRDDDRRSRRGGRLVAGRALADRRAPAAAREALSRLREDGASRAARAPR